jgi:hypothetical protein
VLPQVVGEQYSELKNPCLGADWTLEDDTAAAKMLQVENEVDRPMI